MPSIVAFNYDGEVIYQNTVDDFRELCQRIHDGNILPDNVGSTPLVRMNSLIVLAQEPTKPKKEVTKLTQKQCLVLQCLASSLTPKQTAVKMNLSEDSIREYIKILKKKFKTDSRDQLMAMAGYLGLIDPYKLVSIENQKDNT